jgi:AbrB family looped-hinge helix DNA binding protein
MANMRHSFEEGCICGSATLGERGQLVVPKEARTRLRLKEGERFLVIEHMGKIILVPEVQARHIVNEVTRYLKK